MVDPVEKAGEGQMPNLAAFLKDWGFTIDDDVVVDASGVGQIFGAGPTVPVAASYPSHPITEGFNLMTAYPLSRSITTAAVDGKTPQPVIQTSAQSWAEKDLAGLTAGGEVSIDETKGDRPGPITLSAAVSAPAPDAPKPAAPAEGEAAPPAPESRLVVMGDSDFAANYGLGIQGNRDLFLNTLGWLSRQEGLIAVRPKAPEDRRLTLTADQLNRVAILSIFLIPAAIFGLGIYTWWRRR